MGILQAAVPTCTVEGLVTTAHPLKIRPVMVAALYESIAIPHVKVEELALRKGSLHGEIDVFGDVEIGVFASRSKSDQELAAVRGVVEPTDDVGRHADMFARSASVRQSRLASFGLPSGMDGARGRVLPLSGEGVQPA